MASTSGTRKPHAIFLSHSGQQKPFVRRLYRALCAAGHDIFFDTSSIPPGAEFPPHILENACNCQLGVVVLSPGFLKSKWPMTELHAFHTSPSRPKILPVFHSVKPADLKPSSPKFSEWLKEWLWLAYQDPARVSVEAWQAAVTDVSNIHGLVLDSEMVEDNFIDKVVSEVSSIIGPVLRFDVSHLIGVQRLTQVVAKLLETVQGTPSSDARVLGLHGVGGVGKTTACKLMINHYGRKYLGKCAHIQFPSTGFTAEIAAAECNEALQQLMKEDQLNTHRIDDFDEVVERFKTRAVARYDVFIAIDNVWDDSLKHAQRIVDVGFSSGSMILVTSRSKEILLNLLKNERCVRPLPSLSEDEACQLFARSFNRYTGGHTVELRVNHVQEVTNSCFFRDGYHPLAISAVGAALGKSGEDDWLQAWESKPISLARSANVADNSIKINFDTIPKLRQDMFLDVVAIYVPVIQTVSHYSFYRSFGDIIDEINRPQHGLPVLLVTWLNALYGEEMDPYEIRKTLKELAIDGLLEFEGGKVHVHDLYRDLAAQEAVSRGFVLVDGEELCQRGMIHAEVKKIRIECKYKPGESAPFRRTSPKLRPDQTHKLQAVAASVAVPFGKWNMVHMPELRMFHMSAKHFKKMQLDWKDMPKLSWLSLFVEGELADLHKFGIRSDRALCCLRNLRFLHLEGESALWCCILSSEGRTEQSQRLCLEGLVNLQFLSLAAVRNLVEISGLGSLINLERISVNRLPELVKVGNFECGDSIQSKLQRMQITDCAELREVAGVASLTALQKMHITRCDELREVAGVASLTALRMLIMSHLTAPPDLSAMKALSRLLLSFRGDANITGRKIRNYRLPKLEKFVISGCSKLQEIGVDMPSVTLLCIASSTDKLIDLSWLQNRFVNLRYLEMAYCRALEEIEWSSLSNFPDLEKFTIKQCEELVRITGEPAGVKFCIEILDCPRLSTIGARPFLAEGRLPKTIYWDALEHLPRAQRQAPLRKRRLPFSELILPSPHLRRVAYLSNTRVRLLPTIGLSPSGDGFSQKKRSTKERKRRLPG